MPSTTSRLMTTSSDAIQAGQWSNIVSKQDDSMIERRPRAPVFRATALFANRTGITRERASDIFHFKQPLILLDQRVLRLSQDFDKASSSRSSSVARTGKRPTNSGIRSKLQQIFRLTPVRTFTGIPIVRALHIGTETNARSLDRGRK